jgi:cysteine desulfurase
MTTPIYLDHAATTPCDPRVVEAMLPYFTDHFANPGSRHHALGRRAEEGVERARESCADLLGCRAQEIVFTSGATEGNNLAIKGAAEKYAGAPVGPGGRGHIVTALHEHKATLDPCKRLAREGFDVTFLEPGPDGVVTRDMVENALRDDTILVTIMWANNETGVINEVPAIGALCHERGVVFHTDATQWVGTMPTDVTRDDIDLLTLSGHKMHAPKGVGALYVRARRPRIRLAPQIEGGGQERGVRSGTLNVPGIVGLGKAAEIARVEKERDRAHTLALRRHFEHELASRLADVRVNGDPERRLPHIANIAFAGVEGERAMASMAEVICSAGSTCASSAHEPSHVLRAMGKPDDVARSSLRFSLGKHTTREEVDRSIETIVATVERLRDEAMLNAR